MAKQDWRPGQKPELTDLGARVQLRKRLRAMDWTPGRIDQMLGAVGRLDGFWSYGTVRAVMDLAALYEELVAEYGEPPDRRW